MMGARALDHCVRRGEKLFLSRSRHSKLSADEHTQSMFFAVLPGTAQHIRFSLYVYAYK